jgi:hydroxyacyl-ACP dehydratase HTD2-like protein with hotdog domain
MEISMSNPAPEVSEEIEEELARKIGPIGEPEAVAVELFSATRLAMAVEDFDPIHYDARAAQARGYRGIVAPWPIVAMLHYNCSHGEPQLSSFGHATVHGEDSYEFYEPIIVGDVITLSSAVIDAKIKQGRSGLLGFVTSERRFTNQFGQLCAIWRVITIRR